MSSTKIINILKDDELEELLDIVKETEASEVIFVTPKKTKAFSSEEQFIVLEQEAKKSNKSVAFLCSNPETNELAKKYGFEVLAVKTEPSKPRTIKPKILEEEETEYKEEEAAEPETIEEKEEEPPYGTELDESGNPLYDEKESGEEIGEEITSEKVPADFQILAASANPRNMSDVVRSGSGKHIKVTQKERRPIKIETHKEEVADLDWSRESADNIWADMAKPRTLKQPFFRKNGLSFNYKNLPRRGAAALYVASIFILALIIFLTTGSARIEIKPRSQTLNTQLKVTMSPDFSSTDSSFNRIPGQLFTISKSASDEFNATAEKDAVQKSRGIITIYNEYSTSPQPLVATTRFEYLQNGKGSGIVFRTLQTVTVPSMKVENGIVTPGKVTVEVIADKAGQNYNISAGDFGIMAWREKGDSARYEKIYGRSVDSMHGGILGKAKVVSEFDYNNAKAKLIDKVSNETKEALKTQSAGLELLIDIEPKIDSVESTAEIDDAAGTFSMTVTGYIMTMGYKKEDLMALITGHVEKINDLIIVPDKLELSHKDMAINLANNTLEAVIIVNGQAYAKIDQEDIIANLMGKNKIQIKNYLSSIKDIDSAKVILSPFWVKKIPRNKEKIDVSFTY